MPTCAPSAPRPVLSVLVVEDDELIRMALVRELRSWGAQTTETDQEAEAITLLGLRPDMVVLDVNLKNGGSGVTVARAAARATPMPIVLAISGAVTPTQAFDLAQAGVVGLIQKPLDLETFTATVEAYLDRHYPVEQGIALQVGRADYSSVLANVRKTMLAQALGKAGGNKMAAARLLNITRQAVQQMMHDFELDP